MPFFSLKIFRSKLAQAALELAIFGAILIFVIGSVIRVALSSSYQQNQSLKSMRYVFTKSLESAQKLRGDRNVASVLFIEDRLSADFNRYSSIDRLPFIISTTGTMSHNLYMPLDFGEHRNLGIIDVFVNGQHFTFSNADFTAHDITAPQPGDITSADEVLRRKARDWISAEDDPPCWEKICQPLPPQPVPGDPLGNQIWGEAQEEYQRCLCRDSDGNEVAQEPDRDCRCETLPDGSKRKYCGCQRFYTVVPNGTSEYCDGVSVACPQPPTSVLTDDERFDLKRDGFRTQEDPYTPEMRKRFAWQWKAIKGIAGQLGKRIDRERGAYPSFDVDGDLKEEIIFNYDRDYGPVTRVRVMDQQLGDIDQTNEDTLGPNAPGLKHDVEIFTFVDGAALQIREGKLYNPETKAFVRSVSKKNQVDLVMRIFQLSNDTGRLCGNRRQLLSRNDPDYWSNDVGPDEAPFPGTTITGQPNTAINPDIEACGVPGNDCFTAEKITKTCFDEGTKRLYIRSRIEDTRGRKWIVQTGR